MAETKATLKEFSVAVYHKLMKWRHF